MILVSHRPSLLALADHIYDLTDGRLVPRPPKPSAEQQPATENGSQVVEMPKTGEDAGEARGAQAS